MSPKNLIIIVIDALRARELGCYGGREDISKNIDYLAKEGTLFESAWSCTNKTDISLTSIFSGRYPPSHGIISHGVNVKLRHIMKLDRSGTRFLQEILKKHGYKTFAVDWLGRWHKRGFDYYSGINAKINTRNPKAFFPTILVTLRNNLKHLLSSAPNEIKRGIRHIYGLIYKMTFPRGFDAITTTDYAIDIISQNKDKKFFLFLHYWDTHIPYDPPKKYWKKYLSDSNQLVDLNEILNETLDPYHRNVLEKWFRNVKNVDEAIARYLGEINFVDEQIGRLMSFLRKKKLDENTLVIITSDHGESLLEHGIYFNHENLFDEVLHVPLIFWGPSCIPAGKRIKSFIQHVDILPTVLDLLSLPENYISDGKSAYNMIFGKEDRVRDELYFFGNKGTKVAIRNENFKYICVPPGKKYKKVYKNEQGGDIEEELYNLREDPEELKNVLEYYPKIAAEMRFKLLKKIGELQSTVKYTERDLLDEIIAEIAI